MKKLQAKLIRLLKEDARYTAEELAAMVGESAETVKAEIRALEDDGVIVKYTAITNSEIENENLVEALIEVRVTPKRLKGFDAIAEEINRFKEVRSLYLSGLEGVLSTATHFILKKYKIEGQITYKPTAERQLIHA